MRGSGGVYRRQEVRGPGHMDCELQNLPGEEVSLELHTRACSGGPSGMQGRSLWLSAIPKDFLLSSVLSMCLVL